MNKRQIKFYLSILFRIRSHAVDPSRWVAMHAVLWVGGQRFKILKGRYTRDLFWMLLNSPV